MKAIFVRLVSPKDIFLALKFSAGSIRPLSNYILLKLRSLHRLRITASDRTAMASLPSLWMENCHRRIIEVICSGRINCSARRVRSGQCFIHPTTGLPSQHLNYERLGSSDEELVVVVHFLWCCACCMATSTVLVSLNHATETLRIQISQIMTSHHTTRAVLLFFTAEDSCCRLR